MLRYYTILTVLLFTTTITTGQNVTVAYPNTAWGAGEYLGLVRYIHPSHVEGQKHPCIIWLHGSGGTTDYNSTSPAAAITAANRLRGIGATEGGLPLNLEDGIDISARKAHNNSNPLERFVVIAPAADLNHNSFQTCIRPEYIDFVWQYIRDSLSDVVDTFRVYLAGWSCGGGCAASYVSRSLADAQKVAAFVPIAPTCITENSWCHPANANLPGWFFHGEDDVDTSPGCSSGPVNGINNTCGAAIPALFNNPEGIDHFEILGMALGFEPRHRDAAGVQAPTDSMNIYEWMLQYDRSTAPTTYPQGTAVHIDGSMVFDLTQARKNPDKLFDGDTTTTWTPDNFNGYILTMTNGQQTVIMLDSFINHPRIRLWNGAFSTGGTVEVQFFYDYTDTSRHSPVYSTTLAGSTWKYLDSLNTRTLTDSFRIIKIRIASAASDNFNEVRVTGNNLGVAPSYKPPTVTQYQDPGKFFQGFGELFTDTTYDDAGWSMRDQNDMDWWDTCSVNGNGKVIVSNIFGNHGQLIYGPAIRNGRRIYSYMSGPRKYFKTPGNNNTKDIPPGSDSTKLVTWAGTDSLYYGIVAKFGFNTSASLAGYTYINTDPGAGLGYLSDSSQEIGNEDDARWFDQMRFHTPLVKLMKVKAGYNGVKRADPNIKVISGAITGIDTSYMKAMYLENLLAFQSKAVPWEICAVNQYSTNTGSQAQPGSIGVSPQQDRLYEKAVGARIVRDRYNLGQLYCTESGYDVFVGGNYSVPAISGQTKEQTKAYWVMRSFEVYAAAKWHRMYQYTQRNVGGGDFATTGFSQDIFCAQRPIDTLPEYMHPYIDPTKLVSTNVYITIPLDLYWYMTMRASTLKNYEAWPDVIQHGDSTGVWVLRYDHLTRSDSTVFSIWKGTHSNSTTAAYQVSLPGVATARLRTATVGLREGTIAPLVAGAGIITVPLVNESVQLIEASTTAEVGDGHIRKDNFIRGAKRRLLFRKS